MPQTDIPLLAHLMRRAGFGAIRLELERLAPREYEDIVEDLLHPEWTSELDEDLFLRYYMHAGPP